MIGTRVVVTRATHTGTETILGHIVTPMELEGERVTHVTVEGTVTLTTIRGLPLPIETEREVRLELIPLEPTHPRLLTVKVLT